MKFAHLADCHLGAWREPKLKEVNARAFVKAVDICLDENVDFVLIAGDLFDTSLPSLDSLKLAVAKLKQLRDRDISVYIVPGSHDYSPSGKTFLDVLEDVGLLVNVAKARETEGRLTLHFTKDRRTNAFITGLPGRKGTLEKAYYEALDREIKQKGYKIFLFHTCLSEFKPNEEIDSVPLSILPKGFDYYAGGHVHSVFQKREDEYGLIAYPGPLFPNNFKELEELGRGGFFIVQDGKADWQPVQIMNTFSIGLDCAHKTPEEVEAGLLSQIQNKEFNETIVIIRLYGTLRSGKPSDLDFKKIFEAIYGKSAYFVMKNTNKLSAKGFEEVKVEQASVEEIESKIVTEHLGQLKLFSPDEEQRLVKELMHILAAEKDEGEKVAQFNKRLMSELEHALKTD
jgi:exonuclease SbcD